MEIKEIQELIKFVAKSGISELELELKDFKIGIKMPPKNGSTEARSRHAFAVQSNASQAVRSSAAFSEVKDLNQSKENSVEDISRFLVIKSPMIGTFYRSPSADKPAFVNVGDRVKKGDVICIIEAMKLFNKIEAESDFVIVKSLVEESTPVEYDQPLFLVEPI